MSYGHLRVQQLVTGDAGFRLPVLLESVARRARPRAFGNQMKPEQVIIEARAEIIWGESSSSVRGFLISNGISAIEADAKIKDFNVERNAEIRRLGIKNVVIGAAILGGGTITLYPCFKYFDSLTHIDRPIFIGVFVVGGLYGMWKLVRGISYLVRPQAEERSIAQISQ